MSRVKIVATIGPQSANAAVLKQFKQAGMTIARLNGSHADIDWHRRSVGLIREAAEDIPILLDLPGRKVRLGRVKQDYFVKAGEAILLTSRKDVDYPHVNVNYPDFESDVKPGDEFIIDDSSLRLVATDVAKHGVACRATAQGLVISGKGLHLFGRGFRAELLSNRDLELIKFATSEGLEFIGLSFVNSSADVDTAKSLLGAKGPRIVSKIETQQAIENLSEIIGASDALMIDRGDLSSETGFETVGLLQRKVLAEAKSRGIPVIIATEMLQSMIENPIPTKAEVSDITGSILGGASALMLSGETAVGKYQVDSIRVMKKIADPVATSLIDSLDENRAASKIPQVIGEAIDLICRRAAVTKIVAITISGYAARMIASRFPRQPILAVSNDQRASRSFNLYFGTEGVHIDVPFSRSDMSHIPQCLKRLWKMGKIEDKDFILVTAVGYPKSGNRMNLIELHYVSDLRDSLSWKV